jgi:hypothetical protein
MVGGWVGTHYVHISSSYITHILHIVAGWWFLTILKNISQWEGLSHILWKIKMFETTIQHIMGWFQNTVPSSEAQFLDIFG